MSQTQTLEIMEIPVDKIRPSPYQPRLEFDLEDLRGSIIQYGIRDPLKVRRVGDYWELIDGERRLRIAQQEGMKAVPCLILDYTDEDADALAWRFNVERKDYSVEEKAKHFHKHQLEGMSASAIGRIHGYGHQTISSYLSIFRLPENFQNYVWAGEFSYQKLEYLYNKGLLNSNTFTPPTHAITIIQQSIDQDLKQKEFEKVVDDFILDLKEKQVEAAKKAASTIDTFQRRVDLAKEDIGEPEVKEPETAEEFEEAARTLIKRAKELKTPRQIHQENLEKAQNALNRISFSDAERFGVDVRNYRERVAEIEDYVKDRPVEALKDIKVLQGELNSEVNSAQKRFEEDERKRREAETEKRIEEEAKRRAREIEEAEKNRIELEAKKKAQEEILDNPELIQKASEKAVKQIIEKLPSKEDREAVFKEVIQYRLTQDEVESRVRDILNSREQGIAPLVELQTIVQGQWLVDRIEKPTRDLLTVNINALEELDEKQKEYIMNLLTQLQNRLRQWFFHVKGSKIIDARRGVNEQ
jgi:ParB family chromosome partitioning protein